MLLLLYITIGLLANCLAVERPKYDIEQAEHLFEDFIVNYGKTYPNEREKKNRFDIFKGNIRTINEKNRNNGAVFGINYLADLTTVEIESQYFGFKGSNGGQNLAEVRCNVTEDKDVVTTDAPKSLSWVKEGAVTAVKDQKDCGSCWAFATIGNIESQYFRKYKQLLSLSEQELVDCSKHNRGCNGGIMTIAMTDLITIGGVQEESTYPYKARNQSCQFDKTKAAVKLSGCKNYNMIDEKKFKEVLAKFGPIVLGINGEGLEFYTRGILTIQDCSSEPASHAVLLVGYDTDKTGVDYWLVKNSWGSSWGEQGYFRMKRGENVCGFMNNYSCSALIA